MMKKAFLVLLAALLLLTPISHAHANEQSSVLVYSQSANSGDRDEVCTTLAGTTVSTYYTGDYTYGNLSTLSGNDLLQALRTLMTSTHHTQTSYEQCRDLSVITDCENGDGVTINLLYSNYVVTMD